MSYDPSTRVLHAKGDRKVQLDASNSEEFDRWLASAGLGNGVPVDSGDAALPGTPAKPN